jgi:hypothetical protein
LFAQEGLTLSAPTDLIHLGNGHSHTSRVMHVIEEAGGIPSGVFLLAAGAAILAQLGLEASGRSRAARWFGQWTPTFLLLGIYRRLGERL